MQRFIHVMQLALAARLDFPKGGFHDVVRAADGTDQALVAQEEPVPNQVMTVFVLL